MKRKFWVCLAFVVAFGWTAVSLGEQEEPKVTRMTVHPAAQPRPALKYRLLPGFLERRPGNAAVIYNRIWAENSILQQYVQENRDEIYSWIDMPLDKLPQEKVKKFVGRTSGVYRDFKWAARLESCDWSLPIREGNFLAVLLPDIQQAREPARFLAIRARFQIAHGRFDEAIDTLRAGYALGRNVAEGELLVCDLVGIAICSVMSQQIETMIQQPGCPNLYWALTDLPRPLVDTREAFEVEHGLLDLAFPELRHADDPTGGAEYAKLWIDRMVREPFYWNQDPVYWKELGNTPDPEQQLKLRAALAAMIIRGYPKARRALIAQGRSPQQVDAMPVTQVVAIYTLQTYEELRDEMFKWFSLPWNEAKDGLETAQRRLTSEGRRREVIPLASTLLPALAAVKRAEARCERQIALLRTIEALRLYAAAHDGRLPEKLTDITEVPIPIDPFTGKPIECKIDGQLAVLEVFHTPDAFHSKTPDRRIEIRIAK